MFSAHGQPPKKKKNQTPSCPSQTFPVPINKYPRQMHHDEPPRTEKRTTKSKQALPDPSLLERHPGIRNPSVRFHPEKTAKHEKQSPVATRRSRKLRSMRRKPRYCLMGQRRPKSKTRSSAPQPKQQRLENVSTASIANAKCFYLVPWLLVSTIFLPPETPINPTNPETRADKQMQTLVCRHRASVRSFLFTHQQSRKQNKKQTRTPNVVLLIAQISILRRFRRVKLRDRFDAPRERWVREIAQNIVRSRESSSSFRVKK